MVCVAELSEKYILNLYWVQWYILQLADEKRRFQIYGLNIKTVAPEVHDTTSE